MSSPHTLSEYVLKVHSRCDLACDHCYVYEHADQSWRDRPRVMTPETVRAAARRIAEHADAHRLPRVRVILHGGEPLLLGPRRLRAALAELRATVGAVTRLDLRMQTNGVLLTPAYCDLLAEYDVRVGVSLDGDRAANDRHRRFANGDSSHDAVRRALALLRRPEYRRSYAGILCTIDVRNDPIRVYEALLAEAPPRIDFLLPHATWDEPPYRPSDDPTPYAGWLRRIFRRWLADGRPVPVRLFDSLLSAAAGGPSGTEAVGLDPADLAVIETDGTWEQVDSLKTAYHGAAETGFDVFTHPVDVVATHPGIAGRRGGREELCRTCRECPVVDRCGGGLFPHRYRSGNGFENPSVYCADLKEFISTMNEHPISTARTGTAVADPAVTAVLDQLGAGYGDEESLTFLAETQLAITRALLVAVRDAASSASAAAAELAAPAWELLVRLDTEAPEAVSAVLAYPFVRTWAVRCLGDNPVGPPAAGREPAAGPSGAGYLACLAAAAALRAGVTAELAVPVYDGCVYLPTLGRYVTAGPAGPIATVTTAADGFTVRVAGHGDGGHSGAGHGDGGFGPGDGSGDGPAAWQPLRPVDRDGSPLLLDDVDPHRDCFGWPVAARLPGEAYPGWARAVTGAWRALCRDVPGQLAGLRHAQQVLVPLEPGPVGRQRAATARHAFGAVGVVPVDDPDALAVLLVHELQHAKLNALLDLEDLVDPDYPGRLSVPWRPDPRPVEGVLHGTYAHLAIADVWRARAQGGPAAHAAAGEFRRFRDWTVAAIDELTATGALTPAGERFVGRMRETVHGWPAAGGANR